MKRHARRCASTVANVLTVFRLRRKKWVLTSLLLVGAGSCVEDVLRVEVDLQVTRASSLADVEVQYEYRTDLDDDNVDGSGRPQVDGFVLEKDASTLVFEVFGEGGFGRSASITLGAVVPGSTLSVPVLLAPDGVVGQVSDVPADLGGDACVASDGNGTLFMMGGSSANQVGYVYDGSFAVRSVGSAAAVARPGCAAFDGRVAVVGGCGAGALEAITIVTTAGEVSSIELDALGDVGDLCGAVAAPAAGNGAWFVSSTGRVARVDSSGGVDVDEDVGGAADAVEVFGGDLVVLVDDNVSLVGTDGVTDLGPATALGRRGTDVLVLDGDEVKRVVGKSTERVRILVGVAGGFSDFVVVADDRFVGIDGSDLVVIDSAQDKTTRPMGRTHRRVVAVQGTTIVVAGGAGAGFDGIALR